MYHYDISHYCFISFIYNPLYVCFPAFVFICHLRFLIFFIILFSMLLAPFQCSVLALHLCSSYAPRAIHVLATKVHTRVDKRLSNATVLFFVMVKESIFKSFSLEVGSPKAHAISCDCICIRRKTQDLGLVHMAEYQKPAHNQNSGNSST